MDQMNTTFYAPAGVPTAMKAYCSADAIACLRAAGVPVTHQRIEIARALFSAPVHLSADQIWPNVRGPAPAAPPATGSNTLPLSTERHLGPEPSVAPHGVVSAPPTPPPFPPP